MAEESGDLSGLAGIMGGFVGRDLPVFVGICGHLWESAGICLASHSETLCNLVVGPGVFPRPPAISLGQNSLLDWTDCES